MAQSITNTSNKPKPIVGFGNTLGKNAFKLSDNQNQLSSLGNAFGNGSLNLAKNVSSGGQVTQQATAQPVYSQPLPINYTNTPSQNTQTTSTKGLLTPPTPNKTQNTSTFSSLVGDLSGVSKANKTQKQITKELQDAARGNAAIGQDARDISQVYADEIKRVGNLGAGAQAGYLSSGSNVVGAGNAAIASQSVSQRMQALSDAQQAALEGTGQQLTGQQQTANALNQALQGVNTQQGNAISGFGTAAGLAVPSTAGFGQTTFDPLTGQFGGGQGNNLDPQTAAMQLAQQVKSGSMTYDQAVQSLGYAGGAGQQFLNQALQSGGGFNVAQSQANLQGQMAVLQQLPAMEGADVAAEGIKNKINSYLAGNPQLNPADLAVGNKLQQWIEGKQLTDPKYQTLFNYLNEYTSTLAPILGVGGETTNLKTQIAQEFINAAASGASISEVLENIQGLSRGKIQDLRSGTLGGSSISSPNAGGGTGSGGLFDW